MPDDCTPERTPDHVMTYQLRIEGHLGSYWAEWMGGVTITTEESGHTLLTASVVDQAELHGLLRRVRDLGLPLLSVTRAHPKGKDGLQERG